YTELEGALPPGSVVIAETYEGLSAIVPAFGMSVVAPGYPSAFVDDVDQRNRDVSEFLDASTTDEARRRIAERYDAEAVLCVSDECLREFGTGDVIAQGSSWTLLRLPAF
ncbi:MAG: hypothetical protein ACRDV7_05915, partial [Acidimicrobiia bacterium]